MKRLVSVTATVLLVCFVCLIGVSVAIVVTRNALRSVYSARPTASNSAWFSTGDGRTYYAPPYLVRRREVLIVAFATSLTLVVLLSYALYFINVAKKRLERPPSVRVRSNRGVRSAAFIVDAGSMSWTVPRSVGWRVVRSPKAWGPSVVTWIIAGLLLALAFRSDRVRNISPDKLALMGMGMMILAYPLIALIVTLFTNVVSLDDQGIRVQVENSRGRGRTYLYRSMTDCLVGPSRWVPTLPCLTFKVPGRIRSEKTVRLELPSSADIPAVIRFLRAKGVVCADRR